LSCASRVSNARAAQHVLSRLQQSVRPRRGTPSPRLTPRVAGIVPADSPLACIRWARAAFDLSSAFGRPIDCPRDRRASRAAARRLRPSSSSSSARLARTPAFLSRYWRDALKTANIRHIKLHAARHTCATLMHLQGVPVAVIAAWIGHKAASLTMRLYAHSQDDALMAAGATLDRVVKSCDIDAV
jgi:integrase